MSGGEVVEAGSGGGRSEDERRQAGGARGGVERSKRQDISTGSFCFSFDLKKNFFGYIF